MGESDPDPPMRANAAQMAQRKVKAAPARKGTPGRRPTAPTGPKTTSQIHAINNSVPQFMTPPSQDAPPPNFGNNGGGLFGGAIQAASTFDFAAPNGVSMPAYTPENPDVAAMGGPEAYARYLRGENLDRDSERLQDTRNPKRQFGMPATDTATDTASPVSNNMFGQTNPSFGGFGASAGNTFGGFRAPTSAIPAATFGPTATQSQPTNSMFSFGQTAAAPNPSSPSIPIDPALLGTQSNQPAATTPGGTNIWGAPTSTPGAFTPNAFPQFGAANTPNNPSKSPFPNVTEASATPNTNINANSGASPNDSAMSLVTSPPTTQAPPANNIFDQFITQSASPAPNMFSSAIGNSVFGSQAPSSTAAPQPPITYFGNTNGTPAPAVNDYNFFGNTKQKASPTKSSVFPPASAASPSLFGSFGLKPAEQSSASTNPFPPVGQSTEQNSTPANSFTPNSTEQPSGAANTFGGSNQTPASTSLFATTNQPAEASSVPVDPSQSITQPSTSSAEQNGDSEASADGPPKSSSNLFGSAPKAPSSNNMFVNSNAPSSNNAFGNALNAPSSNIFSNAAKSSLNTMFGNASNAFGATPNAQPSNNTFDNTNSSAQSKDEPLSTLNQPLAQPTPKANETPAAFLSTTPKPNNMFKPRFGNPATPGVDLMVSFHKSSPLFHPISSTFFEYAVHTIIFHLLTIFP